MAHSRHSINLSLLPRLLPLQPVLEPNLRCCFHLTHPHSWGNPPPSPGMETTQPPPHRQRSALRPLSVGWPRARSSAQRESSLWHCLADTHFPDKGTEAQKGPVTCPGTPNIGAVAPEFWRLQIPCREVHVGPVDDLPGAARRRHLRRALSQGFCQAAVAAGTGLGTPARGREGLVRWKKPKGLCGQRK